MKKRALLLLLALPLILAGCQDKKGPQMPVQPDIEQGTIPVIFHVLYEDRRSPVQSPTAAVVRQRLEQMNKFYAATLFTYANIPGVPGNDIGLKFTLATHDPNGKALVEPGIQRVEYAGSTNMSANDFLHSKNETPRNNPIFWDPNRYVNIWLFGFLKAPGTNFDETNVTGISFLPYCTTQDPLFGLNGDDQQKPGENYYVQQPDYMHGMALNNRYFLPQPTVDPQNQESLLEDEGLFTLCHEMGHYLGLLHAFNEPEEGEIYDGCQDPDNASDDGCGDTPKYDREAYMEMLKPYLDNPTREEWDALPYNPYWREPCDGAALQSPSTNVMDYFFGLKTQFTPDQKGRIDFVMAHSPLIPRGTAQTKALLRNFTGAESENLPEPILMRCMARP